MRAPHTSKSVVRDCRSSNEIPASGAAARNQAEKQVGRAKIGDEFKRLLPGCQTVHVRDGVTAGKDSEREPGNGSGLFGDDQPGIQAISQDPAQPRAHGRGGFANPKQPDVPKISQAICSPGHIHVISGTVDMARHGCARFQRIDGGRENARDRIALRGTP
jgi:hypothetical protein